MSEQPPGLVRTKEIDLGLAVLSGWLVLLGLAKLPLSLGSVLEPYGIPNEVLQDMTPAAFVITPAAIFVLVFAITGHREWAGIAGLILAAFLFVFAGFEARHVIGFGSLSYTTSTEGIRFQLIPIAIALAYGLPTFVLSMRALKS